LLNPHKWLMRCSSQSSGPSIRANWWLTSLLDLFLIGSMQGSKLIYWEIRRPKGRARRIRKPNGRRNKQIGKNNSAKLLGRPRARS